MPPAVECVRDQGSDLVLADALQEHLPDLFLLPVSGLFLQSIDLPTKLSVSLVNDALQLLDLTFEHGVILKDGLLDLNLTAIEAICELTSGCKILLYRLYIVFCYLNALDVGCDLFALSLVVIESIELYRCSLKSDIRCVLIPCRNLVTHGSLLSQ